ncbi:MAG: hypothetical protein GY703_04180 [Gammaproteobacteria bacterium]|nr:hypothetical protein [Gammaproteobacteria bacterium]
MNNRKISVIGSALLATCFLVGCGGGGAKVESSTTTTTMGQELMDLNSSYEQGIITEDEYKKAKKKIMKRYN